MSDTIDRMDVPKSVADDKFTIVRAAKEQADAVAQLLQLCLHEFSIYGDKDDVGPDGRFAYPYLHLYWFESSRHPYLLECDGNLAGIALVRAGTPNEMAEFFVLNKYRRRGLATWAARQLFARHPGWWDVHELTGNAPATKFWRQAIPYPYTEESNELGTSQAFEVPSIRG